MQVKVDSTALGDPSVFGYVATDHCQLDHCERVWRWREGDCVDPGLLCKGSTDEEAEDLFREA